jgi:hypothetical protein
VSRREVGKERANTWKGCGFRFSIKAVVHITIDSPMLLLEQTPGKTALHGYECCECQLCTVFVTILPHDV